MTIIMTIIPLTKGPERSEQQEWTPESVLAIYTSEMQDEEGFQAIADAHNDALADERQRHEQASEATIEISKRFVETHDQFLECQADNNRLKDQWELTNQDLQNTEKRELSAQAAIEAHNKQVEDDDSKGNLRYGTKINVDLSLLHQHDADVRKPLVDLLGEARDYFRGKLTASMVDDVIARIDDALAEVKEQ